MRILSDRRRAPGFTLVELLTVVGILAVLMALVMGAARGIRQHAARKETLATFKSLEAGLSKYYDDWGKFPYCWSTGDDSLMGEVAREYKPISGVGRDQDSSAALYAAMTMQERNGPYCIGAGGNVKTFPAGTFDYKAFVDGWGRAIKYCRPRTEGAGLERPFPLLMSEGPKKDMDGVPETFEDNLFNYPTEQNPSSLPYR